MKVAIFGAGAIGAFVGARLHAAGEEVFLLARGPHLDALRKDGLRVRSVLFEESVYRIAATDDPAQIGPVDAVFLTLKAHGLVESASTLAPLLGPDTVVVSTQNGIPWWYTQGVSQPWASARLESVDPGGSVSKHIDFHRLIGSLVYLTCHLEAPGVVEHTSDSRISLGEPDGSRSERVEALSAALTRGGLKAPVRSLIRQEIWVKLLGNASFNPISALTRATVGEVLKDVYARELARDLMDEVAAVAAGLGIDIPISPAKRLAGAEVVGEHRTSMLQDLEAGRRLEMDAILGAVIELADRVQVSTPRLRALEACLSLLESNVKALN